MNKRLYLFISLIITSLITAISAVGVFVGLFIDGFMQTQTIFDQPLFFILAMMFFISIALDIILVVLIMNFKKNKKIE